MGRTRSVSLLVVAALAGAIVIGCGNPEPVAWTPDLVADAGMADDGGSDTDAGIDEDAGTSADAGEAADGGTGGELDGGAVLAALEISPANPVFASGTQLPLTLTAVYSDGTQQDVTELASWISSAPAVAEVSDSAGTRGVLLGVSAGSAEITASLEGTTATVNATVTSATLESLTVSPANPSIARGSTQQFTATGSFSDGSSQDLSTQVVWASSDAAVATISNASGSNGLATGVGYGQTTITATLGSTSAGTTLTVTFASATSLVLSPANTSIATGTKQQFAATASFSDGTTQDVTALATWGSSDTAIATVSNAFGSKGEATGVSAGSTTVSASWNGVTGTTSLTVVDATLTSIAVTPSNASLPAGFDLQFTAIGTYSNGGTQDLTDQVSWSSSDVGVATISNAPNSKGRASGVAAGATTISAALNGVSGATSLQVTNATLSSLAIDPVTLTIDVGQTGQLNAIGTFSDGSTLDVTGEAFWSSSRPSVASVSNFGSSKGQVFGVSAGSATVSANVGGRSATADVIVQ